MLKLERILSEGAFFFKRSWFRWRCKDWTMDQDHLILSVDNAEMYFVLVSSIIMGFKQVG